MTRRRPNRPAAGRAGFTLMEMLVVIMIIGILSAALITNVPDFIDRARMAASEANMREIYKHLLSYQQDHDGAWPKDSGQKFLLRVWKDGYMEKTEANAKRFFSPAAGFGSMDTGAGIVEYLDDWDAIGPGYISYAGFDDGGDRELRQKLTKQPGNTVIMSDAGMYHRGGIVYMTGDGVTHRLLRADIEEQTGLDLDEEEPAIGPGSELELLRTVSNN